MKQQGTGMAITAFSASAFGAMAVIADLAYQAGVGVMELLTVRFGIAALLFLVGWAWMKGSQSRMTLKQFVSLALIGLAGYGFFSSLYFYGISFIPASLAGFILFTYPVIVCLLASILGDEALTPPKLVALAVSLIGASLVLGPTGEGVDARGVLAVMGAAVMYSGYVVASNRILKEVHWFPGATVLIGSCAVFFLLRSVVVGDFSFLQPDPTLWGFGVVLALLSTFLGIGAFFLGLSILGPAKAAIVSLLEPVVTACLGALVLGQQLEVIQLAGASLILVAVMLLHLAREARISLDRLPFGHRVTLGIRRLAHQHQSRG